MAMLVRVAELLEPAKTSREAETFWLASVSFRARRFPSCLAWMCRNVQTSVVRSRRGILPHPRIARIQEQGVFRPDG